jgi:heptaprenylglyceryl phosphate synthase
MIQRVKASLGKTHLIVGGGIRRPSEARAIVDAGADAIVVGTQLEATGTIKKLVEAAHSAAR